MALWISWLPLQLIASRANRVSRIRLTWPHTGPMMAPAMNNNPKTTHSGPKINLRFRTKKELEQLRRIAREAGVSLNSFIRAAAIKAGNAQEDYK